MYYKEFLECCGFCLSPAPVNGCARGSVQTGRVRRLHGRCQREMREQPRILQRWRVNLDHGPQWPGLGSAVRSSLWALGRDKASLLSGGGHMLGAGPLGSCFCLCSCLSFLGSLPSVPAMEHRLKILTILPEVVLVLPPP